MGLFKRGDRVEQGQRETPLQVERHPRQPRVNLQVLTADTRQPEVDQPGKGPVDLGVVTGAAPPSPAHSHVHQVHPDHDR